VRPAFIRATLFSLYGSESRAQLPVTAVLTSFWPLNQHPDGELAGFRTTRGGATLDFHAVPSPKAFSDMSGQEKSTLEGCLLELTAAPFGNEG